MKDFFEQIGYQYCGKWRKLEQHLGNRGNELWIKYFPEKLDLSNMKKPLVYLWFYKDQIFYVGESSKSVSERMRGHEGGFRGSKSGRAKQKYLLENNIDELDVYVCFSASFMSSLQLMKNDLALPNQLKSKLLNEDNMLNAKRLEEYLIIGYFNPILNAR